MARYRKKPVVIEAVQWTGENAGELLRFCPGAVHHCPDPCFMIHTLEGAMKAEKGDWIIKVGTGEFFPCQPDIFEALYDLEKS